MPFSGHFPREEVPLCKTRDPENSGFERSCTAVKALKTGPKVSVTPVGVSQRGAPLHLQGCLPRQAFGAVPCASPAHRETRWCSSTSCSVARVAPVAPGTGPPAGAPRGTSAPRGTAAARAPGVHARSPCTSACVNRGPTRTSYARTSRVLVEHPNRVPLNRNDRNAQNRPKKGPKRAPFSGAHMKGTGKRTKPPKNRPKNGCFYASTPQGLRGAQ